jgi:hypothetical protein
MSVGTGIEPYLILALAALLAGLLDAVAGGGGLIQIPALFGVYPSGDTRNPVWYQQTCQHLRYRHCGQNLLENRPARLCGFTASDRQRAPVQFCGRLGDVHCSA